MKKIVVVGSLNVDYVVKVQHMPAEGETILSDHFSLVPGGKGANQAFALGRMGADVTMLGAVGNDANAAIELTSLRNAGVKVESIARLENAQTGMAFIAVNAQGNNSIIVVPGANQLVTTEYIESKMQVLQSADIVVLQMEIPMETVLYTAKTAKALGKIVVLDPAPAPGPLPDELLQQVDILKPNEIELAALTGLDAIKQNLEPACNALLEKGVGCVLASLGSDGVYVAPKGAKHQLVPSIPVKAVDTTAAGDSFTAAMAFALAKQCNIIDAVHFANRVASVVVTRRGAQSSIPTREEVMELWRKCGLDL